MKRNLALVVAAMLLCVVALYASPTQRQSDSLVKGTVVKVEKHKVYSPEYTLGGSNPSDAPLTSQYYAYEVSVRVDCKTYVGRYETPFNYLPSAFTANEPIALRPTKHVMYFDMPTDPDMRMGIIHRHSDCPSR